MKCQHLPLHLTGDFSDWTTSNDVLPYDSSDIPKGAVVCHLPRYRLESLILCISLCIFINTYFQNEFVLTCDFCLVSFTAGSPLSKLWTWKPRVFGRSCWMSSNLKSKFRTGEWWASLLHCGTKIEITVVCLRSVCFTVKLLVAT